MYASTIVLALGGTASILAAPVAESPVAQAAALAVLLGSCSIWGGIYGGEGSSSCCVYSGGPVNLLFPSHSPKKRTTTMSVAK